MAGGDGDGYGDGDGDVDAEYVEADWTLHVISVLSGSCAGVCATMVTYPLDLLRTRFAAQQEPKFYKSIPHAITHILTHEGVPGLYQGSRSYPRQPASLNWTTHTVP